MTGAANPYGTRIDTDFLRKWASLDQALGAGGPRFESGRPDWWKWLVLWMLWRNDVGRIRESVSPSHHKVTTEVGFRTRTGDPQLGKQPEGSVGERERTENPYSTSVLLGFA